MKKTAVALVAALASTGAVAQAPASLPNAVVVTQAVAIGTPLALFTVITVAAEENNGSSATATTGPSSTAP
jgi:hypothetical protein